MFCSHCGELNSDNAKFCLRCGQAMPTLPSGINPNIYSEMNGLCLNSPQATSTVKRRHLFKKVTVVLIVLVVIVVGAGLIFHKSDQQLITDRLNTFTTAYNEGNLDQLIDCFDPKTQNTLKAVSGVAGSLLGVNVSDLFGLVMGSSSFTGVDTTVNISIHDIQLTGKQRATVDITFICGTLENENCTLHMMKSGWNWYIDMSNSGSPFDF